jgi:hypothetical protein
MRTPNGNRQSAARIPPRQDAPPTPDCLSFFRKVVWVTGIKWVRFLGDLRPNLRKLLMDNADLVFEMGSFGNIFILAGVVSPTNFFDWIGRAAVRWRGKMKRRRGDMKPKWRRRCPPVKRMSVPTNQSFHSRLHQSFLPSLFSIRL